MATIFILIFLVSLIALVVGLIKPTIFSRFLKTKPSRKKIILVFGILIVLSLIMVGIFTPPTEKEQIKVSQDQNSQNPTPQPSDNKTAEAVNTNIEADKPTAVEQKPEQQPPAQNPEPKADVPQPETSAQKSYQQVFVFTGNGAKKSEPFTITGSRFKIKYDCTGELCQAFLYKTNSSLPEIIMNVAEPIKDETIIYGTGEYYIQANTIGSYTMTVEDYR